MATGWPCSRAGHVRYAAVLIVRQKITVLTTSFLPLPLRVHPARQYATQHVRPVIKAGMPHSVTFGSRTSLLLCGVRYSLDPLTLTRATY